MKKLTLVLPGILVIVLSNTIQAQTNPGIDFFQGNWNVSFDGPMGTVPMVIGFEQVDGKSVATINNPEGKELYKVVKTDIEEYKATIIFIGSQGTEIDLVMNKKDDNHADCSIMNNYSALAERKK